MTIAGGYKTLNPHQLGTLIHALKTGLIPWQSARVYFACAEMLAIRESADRVRRRTIRKRGRAVTPCYTRREICRITGMSLRAVGIALRKLRAVGLVEISSATIQLPEPEIAGAQETIAEVAGRRSPRRPIPVPRPLLRYLSCAPVAASGKVILGYLLRGASISRTDGEIRSSGTVKAAWLSDMLGLSLRSVRYAQAQLRSVGWIEKDTVSKQWKLNRHGAWFRIDLEWTPPTAAIPGNALTPGAHEGLPIARPTPDSGTCIAPPKEDRKTPSESKNQKSGVCGTGERKKRGHVQAALPAANLANILLADLHHRERLHALHRQAITKGWLQDSDADALNFYGAAVRARTIPVRDPIGVFVALVRKRQWHHITQAQEDEARRCLSRNAPTVDGPRGTCQAVGAVLRSLLPAGMFSMPRVPPDSIVAQDLRKARPYSPDAFYPLRIGPRQCFSTKGEP